MPTHLLALDIGKRRTGVAYANVPKDFIMALQTIIHKNEAELIEKLKPILKQKNIEILCIGMPFLLDGSRGEQAQFTMKTGEKLEAAFSLPVLYLDERFSSYSSDKIAAADPDKRAACTLAEMGLRRLSNPVDK